MELLTKQNQQDNKTIDDNVIVHSVTAATEKERVKVESLSTGLSAYDVVKRVQDIVLSLLALLLLWPILALIAVAIVADDPKGSPIFTQIRCGKDGKPFKFYKFRTMVVNAEMQKDMLRKENEMDGPFFKIKDDPRITKVGAILRKTSLDELPQLVNIIKGDMSIVGPRPLPMNDLEKYDGNQMRRFSIKQGLTCYWQAQPDRYELCFDEILELDLRYIEECSFITDWKIIFKTVRTVLRGHGE